jgi:hypothetical protein
MTECELKFVFQKPYSCTGAQSSLFLLLRQNNFPGKAYKIPSPSAYPDRPTFVRNHLVLFPREPLAYGSKTEIFGALEVGFEEGFGEHQKKESMDEIGF